MTKVAINGFGRIGRAVMRLLAQGDSGFEVVAINDLTSPKVLLHLLKYDSVHGKCENVTLDGDVMVIGKHHAKLLAEKNPEALPWKDLGVDIVLECTGLFRSLDSAGKHITAGAKKVIISAPAKAGVGTFVMGINEHEYDNEKHHIISNASCTTNCLAPVVKVLHSKFGVVKGLMTTIHSYTNDQRILDLPHSDLRRARAAAVSMIPTTTGAAAAIGLVIPDLQGKIDGCAVRVPTPNVSLVDFVAELKCETTKEEINAAIVEATKDGPLAGRLFATEEELVSVDFNGSTASSTVDLGYTTAMGNMVKVLSWYDNEVGYSARLIDLTNLVASKL
ncbi:type I glyceraldehyde-3-phosphate dehydrogenase [Myxococcota bacterium]|nr:type I glyceraldehyde-3-phosphate dehydrogenase [Myxococcota bacterium]MBU1380766.1 type I glyceraldehyde-3-phosphate dehydrogenase [Myxococcota bacterium]MBU1497103.1 type I glyceraldehyde-3-phosphate dehydrogenase [Myxococcota bacterium]